MNMDLPMTSFSVLHLAKDCDSHPQGYAWWQWLVSLMFCKLFKAISRNLCIAEIKLLMKIPSRNFVHKPKVWLWAHAYKISAQNSHHKCYLWHCIFSWDYFVVHETLARQPPGAHSNTNNTSDIFFPTEISQCFICPLNSFQLTHWLLGDITVQ